MAAEPGEEAPRDPVQSFIDEVFEEMMRETGLSHKTATKYGRDPLVTALVEAAVASLSHPVSSRASEIEKLLFTQALTTALAQALAPALAEALATEITKVLHHQAAPESGNKESAGISGRGRGISGEAPREAEST